MMAYVYDKNKMDVIVMISGNDSHEVFERAKNEANKMGYVWCRAGSGIRVRINNNTEIVDL